MRSCSEQVVERLDTVPNHDDGRPQIAHLERTRGQIGIISVVLYQQDYVGCHDRYAGFETVGCEAPPSLCSDHRCLLTGEKDRGIYAAILPRCPVQCTLRLSTLVVLAGLVSTSPARAWTVGDSENPSAVDVHAFVSQGFVKSTSHDYLVGDSTSGSFEFSEAGINFTSQLTDRLRVGLQLFAYDLGALGTFDVRADWFYLDYRLRDWLGIRAGRVKLVFGLYNDISDIDAARTPILLPQSIYPQSNRYFLLGVTGGELYGFLNLNRAGALDYHIIGGAIPVELPSQIGAPEQASSLNVPYLVAGRLMWETPLDGLRLGITGAVLQVKESVVFPAMPMTPALNLDEIEYAGVGSVEYIGHDFWLAAEIGSSRAVLTDNQPAVVPEATTVSLGGYGMAAYRVTRWLQPAVYYSVDYPNRNVTSGPQNFQDDLAGTLRFDINSFWIVKLEAHYMHGTAVLGPTPMGDPNWGLFLLKTTAYF